MLSYEIQKGTEDHYRIFIVSVASPGKSGCAAMVTTYTPECPEYYISSVGSTHSGLSSTINTTVQRITANGTYWIVASSEEDNGDNQVDRSVEVGHVSLSKILQHFASLRFLAV